MHALAALVLIIRAYDVYGVSARDLRTATVIVDGALAPAGVEARVISCPPVPTEPECVAPSRPTDLLVRIISDPDERSDGNSLGQAFVDRSVVSGSLATLHATRIAALAREARIDFGTLLGRTLAHEVGHLLLGTATHTRRGLMRTGWSASELRRSIASDWRFTALDVDTMRARVAERLRSRAARAQ